jgi:type 1 glutamine amidotransferase
MLRVRLAMRRLTFPVLLVLVATALNLLLLAQITFPGRGKHIVLISGDEEYRSEEALPQLARILSTHHGFRCTVLFAIDPSTGFVQPEIQNNIPGLEALDSADLMIIATRFRDLPDSQMQHIVRYIESGKPVIGMRTATHAFAMKTSPTYQPYSWNDKLTGGFGRTVLGETWIRHHGEHGVQSTRGITAPGQEQHPILRGVPPGSLWSPADVYETRVPLPDSVPLVLGQVLQGMKPEDPPVRDGPLNNPMMPVAWTRTYRGARIFTTTLGAAEDLLNEPFRRMMVNACYWALGMESKIGTDAKNVALVGDYKPSHFGFGGYVKGRTPASYAAAGR